ncbi:MAG: hypothetical protein HYX78_09010, partial [Armatimonadetes bacterium]|nr:hypothetical protein [Armatimonadota bacterium]
MKSFCLLVLILVIIVILATPSTATSPAILFAYYNYPGRDVDTQYRHELQALARSIHERGSRPVN